MNWISNVVRPKIRGMLRREVPENLWIKCPETGQLVFYKDVEANQFVIGHQLALAVSGLRAVRLWSGRVACRSSRTKTIPTQ